MAQTNSTEKKQSSKFKPIMLDKAQIERLLKTRITPTIIESDDLEKFISSMI